ncbi:hypothetical protein Tco_0565242 [Tanacetum coccineum]
MPYPRFTKVIIDYFLSKLKSLKKLKFQHFYTIKDDGAVSRLKFVRMSEDVQQYGLAIPATMLNNQIIQSESYKMFIMYSTSQIPLKKSRGKGSQGKKTADTTEEFVDVSDESDPEPLIRRKTSRRKVVKKKATHYQYRINVRKNADIEMKDAEKTTDITKETTKQPLTSSSFSVPSDYDLVEKYSVLPIPESSKKQESKKSPEEIIRIKREQEEKKQEATNPANYKLYHALIEALIEDENAIDKEVVDTVKDHKRKHDGDDDDDDDEGPPAGSN